MIGGSLYWIHKHQLVARSEIVGFEEAEGGRTNIVVSTRLIDVHPKPRRAHQGWRYLEAADALLRLVACQAANKKLDGAEPAPAETGAAAPWAGFNVHLAAGMLQEAAAITMARIRKFSQPVAAR